MSKITPASFRSYFKTVLILLAATSWMVVQMPLTAANAADLVVRYDQSQLLRMPKPVNQIIIGNPSIADVVLQSDTLLVVTGKTFGVTNIIALDQEGNVIQDQRVIVQPDGSRVVNLMKGAERLSYTCTPTCSPTITIGDDASYFEKVAKHAETKTKFSATGETGGNAAQSGQ